MRKLLSLLTIVGLGLSAYGAESAASAKAQPSVKKSTKSAGASKKAGSKTRTAGRTTRSASTRKGRRVRTTWRNRQLAPTQERYKQIQEALSAKGYLPADQVSGQWNDASAAALKKFQTDQNIEANGKINSLSLIALGLGPKHEAASAEKPAETPPSNP